MPVKLIFRDLSRWLRRAGDTIPGRSLPYADYVQPVEIIGDGSRLASAQVPPSAFAGLIIACTAPDNDIWVLSSLGGGGALVQEVSAQSTVAQALGIGLFSTETVTGLNPATSQATRFLMNNDPPVRSTVNSITGPAQLTGVTGAFKGVAANGTVAWSNIFVPAGMSLVLGPDSATGILTGFIRYSVIWAEVP